MEFPHPKEKAEELAKEVFTELFQKGTLHDWNSAKVSRVSFFIWSKQAALLSVNKILTVAPIGSDYWIRVKEELEKL